MEEIVLFFMSYVFVYIMYQLLIIKPAKKRYVEKNKSKDRDKKELVEIKYLVKRYKLDLEKISYKQLLQIVALVSSFDISLVVSTIMLIENFILSIIVGFILTILLILLSYHFVYVFYKKKGMIKNV